MKKENPPSIDDLLHNSGVEVKHFSTKFMIATNLGKEVTIPVLKDVEKILQNDGNQDYAHRLVGHFNTGRQVQVENSDLNLPNMKKMVEVIEMMSTAYVQKFFSDISNGSRPFVGKAELNDMWINEQLQGDFNPLHSHKAASPAALSGVFYLSAPPELTEYGVRTNFSKEKPRTGADKSKPGWLQIVHDTQTIPDFNTFKSTGTMVIPPIPGSFVLFPKDTAHQVFPFKGDGRRICLAFNVNVWYEEVGITEWSNFMINVSRSEKFKNPEKK